MHPHQLASYEFMCCQERSLAEKQKCENEKMYRFSLKPTNRHDYDLLYDKLEANPRLLCSMDIEKRGGNNVVPCVAKHREPAFMVAPCMMPSHKNHLVCKGNECCSRQHQPFDNWTRPRGAEIQPDKYQRNVYPSIQNRS